MQYNGTEMCEELSTGHSRVEIRKLIAVKQPPSVSTRSFIPVNMHRFLWKGLIQRLFRGIMSGLYRLPISGDKGVAQKAWKKWKKRQLLECFWTLIVHSGRKNEWWGFRVRLVSQILGLEARLTQLHVTWLASDVTENWLLLFIYFLLIFWALDTLTLFIYFLNNFKNTDHSKDKVFGERFSCQRY